LGNPLEGDPRIIAGEIGAVTIGLLYELIQNSKFEHLRTI
jgi:diaminopropionate ammonia-lyase